MYYLLFSTSGSPCTLIKSDKIPATKTVLPTANQFIFENIAFEPIEAIAVCAIVFAALISAALSHNLKFWFTYLPPNILFTKL